MRNNNYVNGNNAVKYDMRTVVHETPTRETLKEIRTDEKRQKKMNMGVLYLVFLFVALVFLGTALVSYVKLQAENTALNKRISSYETRLNDLTLANEDEYSKMVNEVDLENIKKIAIEELGMVYATEDQVIKYTRENSDYVRQLEDIPQ